MLAKPSVATVDIVAYWQIVTVDRKKPPKKLSAEMKQPR
jgi:hypothetical protein